MTSMAATLSVDLDPRTTDFISRPQQMYVDGQRAESVSGRRFDTVDPATEGRHCRIRPDKSHQHRAVSFAVK